MGVTREEAEQAGGFDVYIRRNQDGKVAVYHEPFMWEEPQCGEAGFPQFMWEEGNYECDCNRALFFIRATEHREPEETEIPCGETRYAVVKVTIHGRPDLVLEWADASRRGAGKGERE